MDIPFPVNIARPFLHHPNYCTVMTAFVLFVRSVFINVLTKPRRGAKYLVDAFIQERRNAVETCLARCNECKGNIPFLAFRYTHLAKNYDLCENCFRESTYSFKDEMKRVGDMNFGSLRDWFFICVDEDDNYLLCNLNKKSRHYRSLGVMYTDNHGRRGYWNLNTSSLENVLKEIKTVWKNDKENFSLCKYGKSKNHYTYYV